MKTIKNIILVLLLGVTCLSAQSFTNVVNDKVIHSESFKYVNGNASDHLDINTPLFFFVTFDDGVGSKISGNLKHQGDTKILFSGVSSTTPLIVGSFDSFRGDKQSGEWSFYLETSSPITVHSWGIVSQIPEPNTCILLIVGILIITTFAFKRNKI
jgi:hypothetical protein